MGYLCQPLHCRGFIHAVRDCRGCPICLAKGQTPSLAFSRGLAGHITGGWDIIGHGLRVSPFSHGIGHGFAGFLPMVNVGFHILEMGLF